MTSAVDIQNFHIVFHFSRYKQQGSGRPMEGWLGKLKCDLSGGEGGVGDKTEKS
ncbi:MAG: hypothetical protein ACKERG_02870 [Candidatus Hodgkinia cicadicola]